MVRSVLARYAGLRGDEDNVECGIRVLQRTVVADLLVTKMLPGASLSQGAVFVSRFGTGHRVREVAL